MSVWNIGYRRWTGDSVGVWHRRWTITRYGLRLCLSGKIIKVLLAFALMQSVVLATVFVLFGQLVAPESALVRWIERVGGEQPATVLNGLTSWALLYPEICVDGIYRFMFYSLKFPCLLLSWVTIALFVHRLIANDLASRAIVIYKSKALTGWDYLIGKLGIVSIILSLIWFVPVVVSWVLGNLVSPDWSFFWHSSPSLIRALLLGGVAVVSLSCIALGVSSLAKRTGSAVAYWILGLAALNFAGAAAGAGHPVLRLIDPFESLSAFGSGVYRLKGFLLDAQDILPFFDSMLKNMDIRGSVESLPISEGQVWAPLLVLAAFSVAGLAMAHWRVRSS